MRQVAILVYPGVQVLDVTGPAEVLHAADRLAGGGVYAIDVVAPRAGRIATSGVLSLHADASIAQHRKPLDTLLIAGGTGVRDAVRDQQVVAWTRAAAGRSRRVTSVCTGAFLLAAAGLLDGRRSTTHWASCDQLARRFPAVTVVPDPIFVRDGNVVTSAGVTAGMDLALALVEEDLGRDIALDTARWLVLYLQRPGGQSQFSAALAAQRAQRPGLRDLQTWIAGPGCDQDCSVPALAARAHMSPRHFARAFAAEVGTTPAAYVEAVRVERARQELERSGAHVADVARRCGFGTAETMRRAFLRRLGIPPSAYRERFAA